MRKLPNSISKVILEKLGGRPQSWLSKETGISKAQISRMCSADTEPGLEDSVKIAKAFGMSITEFLAEIGLEVDVPLRGPEPEPALVTAVREAIKQELKGKHDGLTNDETKLLRAYSQASVLSKTLAIAVVTDDPRDLLNYRKIVEFLEQAERARTAPQEDVTTQKRGQKTPR